MRGVFPSRDMVAVYIAALDMADKALGKPGSTVEEKEAMDPGSQKFTGTVGMSQRVTANTCERLGMRARSEARRLDNLGRLWVQ